MRKVSVCACALLFIAGSTASHAVSVRNTASVEIVDISSENILGFDSVYLERSGSGLKNVVGKAGSKKAYSEELPPSEYRISGSKTDAIQIQVLSSAQDTNDVNVDNFRLHYNNRAITSNSVVQDAPGLRADLQLGATLHVKAGTKAGVYEPEFDVAIHYE